MKKSANVKKSEKYVVATHFRDSEGVELKKYFAKKRDAEDYFLEKATDDEYLKDNEVSGMSVGENIGYGNISCSANLNTLPANFNDNGSGRLKTVSCVKGHRNQKGIRDLAGNHFIEIH